MAYLPNFFECLNFNKGRKMAAFDSNHREIGLHAC